MIGHYSQRTIELSIFAFLCISPIACSLSNAAYGSDLCIRGGSSVLRSKPGRHNAIVGELREDTKVNLISQRNNKKAITTTAINEYTAISGKMTTTITDRYTGSRGEWIKVRSQIDAEGYVLTSQIRPCFTHR
jgi:hypothetical protein